MTLPHHPIPYSLFSLIRMFSSKIMPLLVNEDSAMAVPIAKALARGGIDVVEVL